ncbi:MAG: GNAT family N-acetyltransferase, partial [Saprospiraceae bacterium]|nr:GNAT family N-acetyltransferase [Saprospiraceae bacterium]
NPAVMRYITGGKTQNRQEAKRDLQRRMALAGKPLGYWITELESDRTFIGWTALKPLDGSNHTELGYRLLEEYWGCGYATEASRRILEYAFHELQLEEVVAVAVEENRASIKVMEKLGFSFWRHGRFYDTECVCYRLLREGFLS